MFVGVDIGTQSLKAVVTGDDLVPRGAASEAYQPSFPRPGWAEQDPALWERALGPAIAAALAAAGAAPGEVRGLGISGQLDGCIAVDGAGTALGPCLIWMDRRAIDETANIPADLVRRRTGIMLDAGHMAAKMRWLKRHRPDCRTARFHQPVSYLVERLTGAYVIDQALASTTMVCALGQPAYDRELLALFEIGADELPRIADAAACAGRLHAAGAALTGLPSGIPVAVGTGDDFSTPLGAGLIAPGRVAVVLGTAEVVGAVHGAATIDDSDLVETHAYPGGAYFIENPGWLSGGAVAWLSSTLGLSGPAELDRLASEAPPGAAGLTFLPALSGAMAPRWRPTARGCFYGLTAAHGRAHLARALLEGCAFAMRDVIDRLSEMGAATDSILLLGGGARSRVWAQMRADITGRPAVVPARVDTSPIGGAMLAAVASGAIADLATAAAAAEGGGATFLPDPNRRAACDDAYRAYRRLFDSLEPMFTHVTATDPG
jgi:xylulokinase